MMTATETKVTTFGSLAIGDTFTITPSPWTPEAIYRKDSQEIASFDSQYGRGAFFVRTSQVCAIA